MYCFRVLIVRIDIQLISFLFVCGSIIGRGKALHSAVSSLQNFDRSLEKFVAWLSEAESLLDAAERDPHLLKVSSIRHIRRKRLYKKTCPLEYKKKTVKFETSLSQVNSVLRYYSWQFSCAAPSAIKRRMELYKLVPQLIVEQRWRCGKTKVQDSRDRCHTAPSVRW